MLEPNELNIRPIHYLGSKLRMLPEIKKALDEADPTNGTVIDLFSGSGTVSSYLLQFRDVISIDIQNYSKVLCEASMSYLPEKMDIDAFIDEAKNSSFTDKMFNVFEDLLEYESFCFEEAKMGHIDGLYEIIASGSIYIFLNEKKQLSSELEKVLLNSISEANDSKDISISDYLICLYYGGLYFSYYQAIWMDVIEHYIMNCSGLLRTKLLAALLSTASEVVNTVGKQFAQPLKVYDSNGKLKKNLYPKIEKDRQMGILEIFRKWAVYYLGIECKNHSYQIICDDYVSALKNLNTDNVSVVYADPPYTRYHYSRYYHVLETICLRDTPKISTTFPNGRGGISRAIYRENRYQSPFCIKSQAEGAFDLLFRSVKELGTPLVLSYSPFDNSQAVTPRLQTIDQLVNKANLYYANVQICSPGEFTHSKLNTVERNSEANHEAELLIICK